MTYALMQNKAGKFVPPTAANFAAAAAGAKWTTAPGFYLLLLDQPGADAWPITGATFILVHKKQTSAAGRHDVLAFFDWAYKNGDAAAAALDYVPLPPAVKDLVRKSWAEGHRTGRQAGLPLIGAASARSAGYSRSGAGASPAPASAPSTSPATGPWPNLHDRRVTAPNSSPPGGAARTSPKGAGFEIWFEMSASARRPCCWPRWAASWSRW